MTICVYNSFATMSRRGGKINAIRRKYEKTYKLYQTFCLVPNSANYKEIIGSSIKRQEDEMFAYWNAAVCFKYPELGGETADDFEALDRQLCADAIDKPSRLIADKLLRIYYATGELKYIDLYYQCIGNMKLPFDSRRYLADQFVVVKELFVNRVAELLQNNPSYLESKGILKSNVDFTYFDDAKKKWQEQKKRQEEENRMAGATDDKPVEFEYFPRSIYGITDK